MLIIFIGCIMWQNVLDLADSGSADGNSHLPVDILIGSDYYWNLVTGSVCRSEKGHTAIHTNLGWVLSSPTLSHSAVLCSSTYITTTHLLWVDDRPTKITQLAELGVLGTRVSRGHWRRKDTLWWVCQQHHLPRWALQSVTSMGRIPWTPSWQLSPQCEEIEGIAPTTETWPKNFEGVQLYDSRTPSKEVIEPVSPD